MSKANELDANTMDLDLDRLARRAYARRHADERWQKIAMHIDAARSIARSMMSKADVEATQ